MSMIEPGTILLGKFRIERVLGEGGMGVVALAHHLHLDTPVAIKFLRPHTVEKPEVVKRFQREAQAVVKLRSEHVCRVLDVGTLETGAPFIVMEYLEGTDLRAVLRKQGPLDPGHAVDLVLQACEALAEAHAAGIVHRDIKPANLFLTQGSGGGPLVKLLDFGVAKAPVALDEDSTGSHVLLGTLPYMSPEQLESSKNVDGRTDIWALGVVLYELVSGRRPFRSATLAHLAMMISSQPMPAIKDVTLPAGLVDVIARCLEKEPAQRFQSISDLATALVPYAGTPAQAARSAERTARTLGLAPGPLATRLARADSPVPMQRQDTFGETAGEQVSPPVRPPARAASVPSAPDAIGKPVEASLAARAEPHWRRGFLIAAGVASVLGLLLALIRIAQTEANRVSPVPVRAALPAAVSAPRPAAQPVLTPDAGTAPGAAVGATPASPDASDTTRAPATERPAEASSEPASSERPTSGREQRQRHHAPEQDRDTPDDDRAIEDAFGSRTDTRIGIRDRTGSRRESRMRTILAVLMAMALCAGASPAWAQDAASKAAAEQMFQEGRRLMQEARYDEAIARFQASFDLDPGSGTQGNIALCYERMGKLASAWGHYRETANRARREGNAERARVALERAAALEPRLPRLRIRLSPQHAAGAPADLLIERNDTPVPAAMLDTAVYVDPGEYRVEATAPGRTPFSDTVTLREAEERTVEIPALAPIAEPAAEPAARTDASPGRGARAPATAPADVIEPRSTPGRGRRIAGLITGGTGLAVLALGIGVGVNASATWDDAFESGACNAMTLVCSPEGQVQTDTARTRARVSNILVGTGVVAIAAGAILYLTAPSASSPRTARLVPFTAEDTFGMAVIGGF